MKMKKKNKKNNNIILIGFMGVGKGRTARTLAEKTGMYALDCDDLIESYTNLKVKQIFAESGEETFRQLERKTALWLEKSVSKTIVSTGGGFFKVPNIKKLGTIILLNGQFDAIIDGIMSHPNVKNKIKKRPLLQDLKAAKRLYKERLPQYRQVADFEVNVPGKSIESIVKEILSNCKLD